MDLHAHLVYRGMVPEMYNISYDNENSVVTFFLYNLSGRIVGYQQYRPDSMQKKTNDPKDARYYTYSPAMTDVMFGLEALRHKNTQPLYVVEGVFKAANLTRLGYDSIAVLTSDPKRMRPFFRILKATRPIIGIGDNDPAGKKLVKRVGRGDCSPIDLDEMSDNDIVEFVEGL